MQEEITQGVVSLSVETGKMTADLLQKAVKKVLEETFDAVCRTILFDIAKRHGLHLDQEPSYGGRDYLEKQDYILMKQKEQLMTAWFMYWLQGDEAAGEAFFGADAEIGVNENWQDVTINFP